MTGTMISPEPQPENRWFKSVTGGLNEAEPSAEQQVAESAAVEPLPKRPVGKHRTGTPAHELVAASLATPTPADMQEIRAIVGELDELVASAIVTISPEQAIESQRRKLQMRQSRIGVGAEHRRQEQADHTQRAGLAAGRVSRGHLDAAERQAIAAAFTAYSVLPYDEVLPTVLLVTLERAMDVLTTPRTVQQTTDPAVAEAAPVAVRDGAE